MKKSRGTVPLSFFEKTQTFEKSLFTIEFFLPSRLNDLDRKKTIVIWLILKLCSRQQIVLCSSINLLF